MTQDSLSNDLREIVKDLEASVNALEEKATLLVAALEQLHSVLTDTEIKARIEIILEEHRKDK